MLGNRNRLRFQKGSVALETLSDSEDINKVWENIQEIIKTSAKNSLGLTEWKQHKPCFDENV